MVLMIKSYIDWFHYTIFNVFEDDVRQNVLQPGADSKRYQMQVSLGHVGEFHYLSLRPCRWTDLWPYSKYVYRLMILSSNICTGQLFL